MINILFPLIERFIPGIVNSRMKLSYLRAHGVEIGEGTVLYGARHICINMGRPELIKIGKYCKITRGGDNTGS